MNWRLPEMVRYGVPKLPAWWGWLAVPAVAIALSAIVLFFTWPVQRGFTDLRFWFWLLLLPLLLSSAVMALVLSGVLQSRRQVQWRHLFIDQKYAHWQAWGRRSLRLVAFHCVTPSPDIASRALGLEGMPPQAPSKPEAIVPVQPLQLGESPLKDILSQTLTPLHNALRSLPAIEIWLYANTQEEQVRSAVTQYWSDQLKKRLPVEHIHWQSKAPDASLLQTWCDEESNVPRLVIALHGIDNTSRASACSTALLFQTTTGPVVKAPPFRPVYLFRPLLTQAHDLEADFPRFLATGQTDVQRLSHLWDAGLQSRERGALLALMDESGVMLPAQGRHDLTLLLGPQSPASFWLALCLAAQGADLGQRGQLVAAQTAESISLTQLSTRPAAPVNAPPDTVSRYPLAYLGGIFAVMLALILLPGERDTQMAMLPWLGGGFVMVAALLSFAVPLALHLWRKQLDVEWHLLEQKRHD
ncbi:hypothetical protein CEQ20_16105 [Yersinia pseudotuberculosis]|uniref:Uncharacterized protein n=2 Tax=Yersinia pseudotuberculosis TaxID=633 RepID=A0ABN5R674_YERPU|nr:hypothetical protein [Yersinia pseudotuberculosis]AIN13250.1 hypothetical protein DJ40_3230 [Yersinia pseudotuberculosis]AXY34754.1 hypothetical protein CEQ20_16105 [Yersinia pseudotuberculosis]AYW92017.1 hypothetical protein EGX47_12385 [Yersinia pseudotuberculosis]AYX10357.1 hypothetical protein EGX52_05795 [Yersinia pseudotuberculosis]MBO1567848.1 hypothetical protein [Yersinia pseudotuberculosis]